MNAHLSTHDLVRDDVPITRAVGLTAAPDRAPGRVWALTGLAAGVLMAGGTTYIEASGNPAYDRAISSSVWTCSSCRASRRSSATLSTSGPW